VLYLNIVENDTRMMWYYDIPFKCIGQSLRQGSHVDIQLERFEEALHDPSSKLTYTALFSVQKQSVEDVEQLFGDSVIQRMKSKAYTGEARILALFGTGDAFVMKGDLQNRNLIRSSWIKS